MIQLHGNKKRQRNNWDSEQTRDWQQQEAWSALVAGSTGEKVLISSMAQLEASDSLTTSLQNSKMFNNLLLWVSVSQL